MGKPDNDITNSFAAVDLGSNSFHMVVARVVDGNLNVIDRIREPVRLANGLDRYKNIKDSTWERAINCLEQFGERVKGIPPENIRAVGTNTFRRAKNSRLFHTAAEDALHHPIEIISGIEEARLIYAGAIRALPEVNVQRLMIDIGGSSTEIIVGKDSQPLAVESLEMGCVTFTQKYFPKGKITKKRFKKACTAAQLELEQWANRFKRIGWQEVAGTSGTIKTIARVLVEQNWSMHGIDHDGMQKLASSLIESGQVDNIELAGLSQDRKPVFVGGVAVLLAVMDLLCVESMQACDNALREGVLFELMGTEVHMNVQSRTIGKLTEQFHIDALQAERVCETANQLYAQLKPGWQLDSEIEHNLINWAARIHEIGLSISHGHYHRHGAYILSYADMPGFTQQEQNLLSVLVLSHRRKLSVDIFDGFSELWQTRLLKLCVILRIAVIIHRARLEDFNVDMTVTAHDNKHIKLVFPDNFLQDNALIAADFETEKEVLSEMGFTLEINLLT